MVATWLAKLLFNQNLASLDTKREVKLLTFFTEPTDERKNEKIKEKNKGWTEGQTMGRTDRRTDGRREENRRGGAAPFTRLFTIGQAKQ